MRAEAYADLGYRHVGTGARGRCRCCGERSGLMVTADCEACGGRLSVEGSAQPGRGEGAVLLRLRGLASGDPAPGYYDGEYLKAYDPFVEGRDPDGEPMLSLVETTPNPEAALRFSDVMAARREWMRWDGYLRPDGQPSRPLTAFNVELSEVVGYERAPLG